RCFVEHDDAAVLGLGRERVLEGERAHLLGQTGFVAARRRAESTAAPAEDVDSGRAVSRAAGALLPGHFLAGAVNFGAVLHRMSAGAALGELPHDAALNDIGARIEPEDRVRHGDRAGRLAVESGDLEFHHAPSCGTGAASAGAAEVSGGAAAAAAPEASPAQRDAPGRRA